MKLFAKYRYSTDRQFVADLLANDGKALECLLYDRYRSLLRFNAMKAAPQVPVDDLVQELYLYLSADNGKGGEKRLHPVADAGTDDKHLRTFCLCLFQQTNHLWSQQMARTISEVLAKAIEIFDGHPLEEPREHALFRLSIIIEPQLHQHQQRGMEQEAQYETGCATGKADKLDQSVAGGEGAVEVASV